MRLGFAAPISLSGLRHLVEGGERLETRPQFGPSAHWVLELLRRGHDVTVYATSKDVTEPQTYFGTGLTLRIAPLRKWNTGRDFFAEERRQLTALMREDRCEVIHAHWTYEFALAALSSGRPTLVTIHDLPWRVLYYFRDPHRLARLVMAYHTAMLGNHFSAVSEDAARHFRRWFKPMTKIAVVPNPVPESILAMGGESKLSTGPIVFATVLQGWSRRKNAAVALRAFAQVRKEIPGSQLLMFGTDYQEGGPANRWAMEQGISDSVTFVGLIPYEDLLQQLKNVVDVVVHPSLDEAFSMVALESMALHKVVIAGLDTPGMRQALDGGTAGTLVNVRSVEDVAKAMLRLAKEPEYRRYLSDCAYRRAETTYPAQVIMSQYEELYAGLIG